MLYCIFKELQTLNAKSLNDDFVLMPKNQYLTVKMNI